MDVTFRLTPADLSNYRYAVRDRLGKVSDGSLWSRPVVRWAAFFLTTVALLQLLDRLVPSHTGAPVSAIELSLGFLFGATLVLGLLWLHYWEQTKKLVSDDGPTLSEHTIAVNTSGVSVTAPHLTAHYAWPAIQEVTRERGLIVLWLEPSVGLAVPEHAFSRAGGADDFVAAIASRRTEAELPRAGSFA